MTATDTAQLYACIHCTAEKSAEEFFRLNVRSDTGLCKECRRTARNAAPSYTSESTRAYNAKWREANRQRWLDSHRKQKYGLEIGGYERMLDEQEGGCAICHAPPPADKALHVDHNHKTGEIRALLCDTCNRGLGYFKDQSVLLDAAASYLRRFKC